MEIFKSIEGFPHYWIGDHGTVLSTKTGKKKVLKTTHNGAGYKKVMLISPTGQRTSHYIHHLVAKAFLPPKPSENLEIDHVNGLKIDNRACNLQYLTRPQNSEKAHNKPVICCETEIIYESAKKASLAIGKSKHSVAGAILRNGTSGGYTWRYLDEC